MAKSARHNTGKVVLAAIKKLTKNTGWTVRAIVKFIRMEYDLNYPNLSREVSRVLKRGVKLGLLHMECGRYRLNGMSRLARSMNIKELRSRKPARQRESGVRMRSRSRTPLQPPPPAKPKNIDMFASNTLPTL